MWPRLPFLSFWNGDGRHEVGKDTRLFLANSYIRMQSGNGPMDLISYSTISVNSDTRINLRSKGNAYIDVDRYGHIYYGEDLTIRAGTQVDDKDLTLKASGGEIIERTIDDTAAPLVITSYTANPMPHVEYGRTGNN